MQLRTEPMITYCDALTATIRHLFEQPRSTPGPALPSLSWLNSISGYAHATYKGMATYIYGSDGQIYCIEISPVRKTVLTT